VVGGVDVGAEAAMPIYQQAGVPYVSGSPQLNGELNSTNSFSLTGGTVTDLLGILEYLTSTRKVDSVHALYVDLPGLLSVAIQSSERILRAKDVSDVTLVAEKADAADFAPALSRVAAGEPDAIVIVFNAQACARIVQAASALAIDTPMFLVGSCATPAVAQAAGGNTDNLFFASGYVPVAESGGDADSEAFRDRVAETEWTSGSQGSFSAVVVLRSLLADLPDVTPGALTTALRATRDHPNVMAHPFTCDGMQIAILPSICNTAVRLLQWKDGAFADVTGEWIDGRQLTDLLG
jgi:branched-chain amino acid transport system substrate-binding protein